MNARTKAEDAAFLAIAHGAAADLCRAGSDYRNPHIPSSPKADAYAIGAWVCYHQGRNALESIHKSRGYDWTIETRRGGRQTVRVVSHTDHRAGVAESTPRSRETNADQLPTLFPT